MGVLIITSLIGSEAYEDYLEGLVDAFHDTPFFTAGVYAWLSMTALGAVKASKILDNFQQVNKTVITAGKGAIYLLTAGLLGSAILSSISDDNHLNEVKDNMPLSILHLTWDVTSLIGILALPPLGVRYCIDLINLYQNRAQAAVKKMQ
jgi:hypothetical protein